MNKRMEKVKWNKLRNLKSGWGWGGLLADNYNEELAGQRGKDKNG